MGDLWMAVVYQLIDELVDHYEIGPHDLFFQAPTKVMDHLCHLHQQFQSESRLHLAFLAGEDKEQLIPLNVNELNASFLLTQIGQSYIKSYKEGFCERLVIL